MSIRNLARLDDDNQSGFAAGSGIDFLNKKGTLDQQDPDRLVQDKKPGAAQIEDQARNLLGNAANRTLLKEIDAFKQDPLSEHPLWLLNILDDNSDEIEQHFSLCIHAINAKARNECKVRVQGYVMRIVLLKNFNPFANGGVSKMAITGQFYGSSVSGLRKDGTNQQSDHTGQAEGKTGSKMDGSLRKDGPHQSSSQHKNSDSHMLLPLNSRKDSIAANSRKDSVALNLQSPSRKGSVNLASSQKDSFLNVQVDKDKISGHGNPRDSIISDIKKESGLQLDGSKLPVMVRKESNDLGSLRESHMENEQAMEDDLNSSDIQAEYVIRLDEQYYNLVEDHDIFYFQLTNKDGFKIFLCPQDEETLLEWSMILKRSCILTNLYECFDIDEMVIKLPTFNVYTCTSKVGDTQYSLKIYHKTKTTVPIVACSSDIRLISSKSYICSECLLEAMILTHLWLECTMSLKLMLLMCSCWNL
jgi:hypothetical protein